MRQVQVNLVTDKLTNELGEKYIYQGLYNENFGNYYVFNLNRPYSLLVLSEKEVENVNFNLSDDQLLIGKSLSLVRDFAISSILLHRARKVKRDYEDQAEYLSKNEDNLSLAAIVSGYAALDKDTKTYVNTLSDIKGIKGDLNQTREEFKDLSKEVLNLSTREEYLGVLLVGTDAKVDENNLYLGLRLSGYYASIVGALRKISETFTMGGNYVDEAGNGVDLCILKRVGKYIEDPKTTICSYVISTDLSDKYTLVEDVEMNK